jgi:hypothetical protein
MFATSKSLRGNKCAQVFSNGFSYNLFYPLEKELDAADALMEVIQTVDIPMELVLDGAKAETQGNFGCTNTRSSKGSQSLTAVGKTVLRPQSEKSSEVLSKQCTVHGRPNGSGTTVENGLQLLSDGSPHMTSQGWTEAYQMR